MIGFDDVSGHRRPIKVLKRALATGRVPHAYLFWGPEGIGKELTARVWAAVLFCDDPRAVTRGEACGACPACRKSQGSTHPDLHLLAPGEKAISVDEVRGLQERLSFQAYEKGRKIVIIRDAHRMTPSGANALLKTVEEPPKDTFIVLIATESSALLPTLVSRCQALRFDPLGVEEVRGVLVKAGIGADEATRLAELSDGSPGVALSMGREEVLEAASEAERIAAELTSWDVSSRFELADRWSKDKEHLEMRLTCLERALAGLARQNEAAHARLERLFAVRGLLERNVNAQLALDALFVLDAPTRLEEML